jgi:uncharacterized protein
MAHKLLIIMVNIDPRDAATLHAPLVQATVAAAMDYEVEVVLSGRVGELAIQGVAAQTPVIGEDGKTVHDLIRSAREVGVKFKVCAPTVERWGDDLITEIDGIVGSAYLISEAMDDETVTFTY